MYAVRLLPWNCPVISTAPLRNRAEALKAPFWETLPRNAVSKRGPYLNRTSPRDTVSGYSAPGGGSAQSPVTIFVRLSSPMYWPSCLAEPCAQAAPTSTAPSSRPDASRAKVAPPLVRMRPPNREMFGIGSDPLQLLDEVVDLGLGPGVANARSVLPHCRRDKVGAGDAGLSRSKVRHLQNLVFGKLVRQARVGRYLGPVGLFHAATMHSDSQPCQHSPCLHPPQYT